MALDTAEIEAQARATIEAREAELEAMEAERRMQREARMQRSLNTLRRDLQHNTEYVVTTCLNIDNSITARAVLNKGRRTVSFASDVGTADLLDRCTAELVDMFTRVEVAAAQIGGRLYDFKIDGFTYLHFELVITFDPSDKALGEKRSWYNRWKYPSAKFYNHVMAPICARNVAMALLDHPKYLPRELALLCVEFM